MARFMRKGTTKFWFVPTIADLSAPTEAEITAGEDITTQVATVNGFNFANSPIQTPDMDSTFTKQIPGEDVAADSSLDMYELDDDVVIHDALLKSTEGYMVIFYKGATGGVPTAGDFVDVWPCTVSSNSRQYSADNVAAMFMVNFSITDVPYEDAVVAA